MKSLGLSYFTDIHLTALGLLIFFGFFCSLLVWTSLSENRRIYKRLEKLPFEDGDSL